jgi:hypothetical protein
MPKHVSLAIIVLGFLLAGPAHAQDTARREHHSVNVSTSREGQIAYYASPDESCGKGVSPEITITEQHSYGKIVFRRDRLMAFASTIPPRAVKCRGKFVDVTSVFYKPAAKFHGSDRAVLRIRFPVPDSPTDTLTDEIYITVR